MNGDEIWQRVLDALELLPQSDDDIGSYILDVGLHSNRRKRNRVLVLRDQDFVKRSSEGGPWRTIRKDDLLWFAHEAFKSGSRGFDITETTQRGGPSHMGSIVCTMLSLLDEFKYEKLHGEQNFSYLGI